MDHDTCAHAPISLDSFPRPALLPLLQISLNTSYDILAISLHCNNLLLFCIVKSQVSGSGAWVLDLPSNPVYIGRQWWDGSGIFDPGQGSHFIITLLAVAGTNPNINYHFYSILSLWCMISRQGSAFRSGNPRSIKSITRLQLALIQPQVSSVNDRGRDICVLSWDAVISDNKQSDK